MGNSNSKGQRITTQGNVQNEWRQKQKTSYMNVWCRKDDPDIQLQQYEFYINDQKEFMKEKGLYYLRKGHPYLVATRYFTEEEEKDFCASNFKGTVFIERVQLRLSNITDIPFPDILHVYDQALQGYDLLSKEFGFFEVGEEKICVNSAGVIKVWANQQLERSYNPKKMDSEALMVRNLLSIIENNTDRDTMPREEPSLFNYIYRGKNQEDVDFNFAQYRFGEYVKEFGQGEIPNRLACFDKVGGTGEVAKQIENPSNLSMFERRGSENNYRLENRFSQGNQSQQVFGNSYSPVPLYMGGRHSGGQFGSDSQVRRHRSVEPVLRGSQIQNFQTRTMMRSPLAGSRTSGGFPSQNRISENQYVNQGPNPIYFSNSRVKTDQGQPVFRTSRIYNQNPPINGSHIQMSHNLHSQNSQVKLVKQLEPRQVAVMESLSKPVSRNFIPQNGQLETIAQASVHEQSLNQSPNRQGHTGYSDIFEARPVQASNIVQHSGADSHRSPKQHYVPSKIGKEKPIYQSNVISENEEGNVLVARQFKAQNGINNPRSQVSKGSAGDSQVQWQDYTQEKPTSMKKSAQQERTAFSKKDIKKYHDEQANGVKTSSVELLNELKQVRNKASEEISKSRTEAEREAQMHVRKSQDRVPEFDQSQDRQVFSLDGNRHSQPVGLYPQNGEFVESHRKTEGNFNSPAGLNVNGLSGMQTGGVSYSVYESSQGNTPSKAGEGYHVEYDPELLKDLNGMKG